MVEPGGLSRRSYRLSDSLNSTISEALPPQRTYPLSFCTAPTWLGNNTSALFSSRSPHLVLEINTIIHLGVRSACHLMDNNRCRKQSMAVIAASLESIVWMKKTNFNYKTKKNGHLILKLNGSLTILNLHNYCSVNVAKIILNISKVLSKFYFMLFNSWYK